MIRKRSSVAANMRRLAARAKPQARAAVPILCPRCQSDKTRVTHTRERPIRYHHCEACGQRFKSIERLIRGEPLLKGE